MKKTEVKLLGPNDNIGEGDSRIVYGEALRTSSGHGESHEARSVSGFDTSLTEKLYADGTGGGFIYSTQKKRSVANYASSWRRGAKASLCAR